MAENEQETEQKDDWTARLVRIREKQRLAAETERANREKAQFWVMEKLTPTFLKLAKALEKQQGIESISTDPTPLGESLRFRVIDVIVPVFLSYSVRLDFFSQGVMGHIELAIPGKKKYSTPQSDILNWGEDEIINDFLTRFESSEV